MFVLPPLPNSLFTRDSPCWIFGGVSINPMCWPAFEVITIEGFELGKGRGGGPRMTCPLTRDPV